MGVDAYLAGVPEERREALTRRRDLCRTELAGFAGVMAYWAAKYARVWKAMREGGTAAWSASPAAWPAWRPG